MLKKIHFNILLILGILIPPSLITGPFLPDFFICLMGLIYISLNFKNFKNFFKDSFTKLFVYFYLLIIISTIFSYNPLISIESSLFYFRFLFFTLATLYLLDNSNIFIKYLIISFSITFTVLLLDSFIQYTVGVNLTGYSYNPRSGINSFFGTNEDGILGSYFTRLCPIFCSLIAFKYNDKKAYKYLILLLLLFSSIISIFAQERASFFLSIIPLFIYIFCTKSFDNKIKLIIFSSIFLLFLIIILLNQEIFIRFIVAINNQAFLRDGLVIFSAEHQAHYSSSIKMFFEEPFLGIGPKMFRHLCDYQRFYVEMGCSTHPHNTYFQLLAETGIFSFSFIFFLFIYFMKIVFAQIYNIFIKGEAKYTTHFMLIISAIIITLWPVAPTNNFFNNWINVIYFFPIGFLLYYLKNNFIKT